MTVIPIESEQNLCGSLKELKRFIVPGTGFEPAQPFGCCHLKTVRLPISPPGHSFQAIDFKNSFPTPDFKYFSFSLAFTLSGKDSL